MLVLKSMGEVRLFQNEFQSKIITWAQVLELFIKNHCLIVLQSMGEVRLFQNEFQSKIVTWAQVLELFIKINAISEKNYQG